MARLLEMGLLSIFRLGILLLILLSWTTTLVQAQDNYTISGLIQDAESGEVLIGANIAILGRTEGTTTNNYGFYSITIAAQDSIGVAYSYLGYMTVIKKIYLHANRKVDVFLKPVANVLDQIVVTGSQHDDNIASPQMGVIDIPTAKIKELPAILGEPDVLKTIQLLPGVQAGNEGTTGFHVRGGSADQNLVQLDEATVYNPNHLFGLFSTFNTRAINKVTLIKGGFPAQYGGRLSSIVDINMKEGNRKQFKAEGGIGLISTQITVEGPLKKDEASFIISGRRTYFDWLIKPFLSKKIRTNYSFYDLNVKMNWKIGAKDHLYLSAFRGNDDALYSQDGIEYNIFFGNQTATLRWNRQVNPKMFLNSSFLLNYYNQDIAALQDNAFTGVSSGINDLHAKIDLQYYPNSQHKMRFGAQILRHDFESSGDAGANRANATGPEIQTDSIPHKRVHEFAFYMSDEMTLNDAISAHWGMRTPGYLSSGANYYRIEPRLALKVSGGEHSSVKLSYTMMHQFVHLIPSSTAAVPTDIWIPSTRWTRPQRSQQLALGYFQNQKENQIESSVELYYKTMNNQVLFGEGNQLIQTLDVDPLLVYGEGWSYGSEFFIKKKQGRVTGWAAYTLSWTHQKFDKLNFGRKFPFRYDRRHDLSLVMSCDLSKKWKFAGTFVFSSGSTYTVPAGRINAANGGSLFEGNYFVYNSRNNTRLAPYHRLDLSFIYRKDRKIFGKKYESEIVLSTYNVYSRQNPYFIYFRIDPLTDKPTARQVSLLPIIPGISYNFKF